MSHYRSSIWKYRAIWESTGNLPTSRISACHGKTICYRVPLRTQTVASASYLWEIPCMYFFDLSTMDRTLVRWMSDRCQMYCQMDCQMVVRWIVRWMPDGCQIDCQMDVRWVSNG